MPKPLSKEFLINRGYCCNFGCLYCPYKEKSVLVTNIDGESVKWQIKGKEVRSDNRPRSSLHLGAREILKKRFPTQQILEEVPVPIKRGKTLFLDFYLPLRKIAIEVHGEQHYKRSTLYHSSAQDFLNQKSNDRMKEEWCELNGITHIVLPFDEIDNWGEMI